MGYTSWIVSKITGFVEIEVDYPVATTKIQWVTMEQTPFLHNVEDIRHNVAMELSLHH